MDYHELKKFAQDFTVECAKHSGLKPLADMVGRLVSHMQSEQATMVEHGRRLGELEGLTKDHDEALFGDRKKPEDNPGLVHTMSEIKKLMKTIKHIGVAIVIGLSLAGVKWVCTFIFEVSKKL